MNEARLKLGAQALTVSISLLLALACSASSSSTSRANANSNSSANGITSGGAGSTNATGSQPGFVVTDASPNGGTGNAGDGEVVACTNGDDCVCPTLSVAVIGTPGKWGSTTTTDSDTAFQDWLNSSSSGTARVDNYTTKPPLTADFLAGYNVIILAGLGADSNVGPWWVFDSDEIAAFQAWVEKGGGVISLSGYSGDGGEVTAKNSLLAFTGISYNQDGLSPPCAIISPSNGPMCWCMDGSLGTITEWNHTDALVQNISLGVTMIGVATGRTIVAPADAYKVATTPSGSGSANLLVAKVAGQGRVLVFSDEWITYTSQWNGQGAPGASNPACQGYLPQDQFQTAQFWYNMIRWTQPSATCFKIVDRQQSVTVW